MQNFTSERNKMQDEDDDEFDGGLDLGPDEYFAIAVVILIVIGVLIWGVNMRYS